MLKKVAFDSAATALALWEEAQTVIGWIIQKPGYHQQYAKFEAETDTNNSEWWKKLTSMVFPFPGGPNKSKPRAGALKPVKSWMIKCKDK